MATSLGLNETSKVSLGNTLIFSKISIGNEIVYSAGNTVTYHVDTNVVYQEEVDADETVLSPKFTPTKEGWEFVGWRQDDSARADVLDNLVMGDNPITLYAVFQKDITLSYNANGGSGTMDSETKQSYYNNETISNPTFILSESSYVSSTIEYSFDKWAEGSPDGTQYATGSTVTLDNNTVFYATWVYVGNPFYIVKDGVAQQYITLTKVATQNVNNISPGAWGGGNKASISTDYVDYNKAPVAFVKTAAINTKNNRTLSIIVDSVSEGGGMYGYMGSGWGTVQNGGVWVNGKFPALSGTGKTLTFDVSGLTTVEIYFCMGRHAQSYEAWISIKEIRLY